MSDAEPVRGRWKKGESGNPSGRAKRIAELHAMAQENYPLALKRLEELINSRDEDMAFKAVSFTFLYVLGRPLEGSALLHMDAMRAKLTELVIAKPVEATPALPPPAVPEKVEAPSLTRPPAPPPPEAPRVHSGDMGVPSGLIGGVRSPDVSPADVLTGGTQSQGLASPSGYSPETHALRCLYRSTQGQCGALCPPDSSWCEVHRAKLFEAVNA